jgi:hypothetical protein
MNQTTGKLNHTIKVNRFGRANRIITVLFFTLFFLYFWIYNRFHLSYLEQNQLFRYNWDYIRDFFTRPGVLVSFMEAFLVQFFKIQWIGALILTLIGVLIFQISRHIFTRHRFDGIVFSLLPVLFIAACHSRHNFPLKHTLGYLLSLLFFAIFISIPHKRWRIIFGTAGWTILYFLSGSFSFVAILLSLLHEWLYRKNHGRIAFSAITVILVFMVPTLSRMFIYWIGFSDAWLIPVAFPFPFRAAIFFILFALYYPLVVTGIWLLQKISGMERITFAFNLKNLAMAAAVFLILIFSIYKIAYDPRNELFLRIDDDYQHGRWDDMLTQAKRFKGKNQLVMYYTNLALFKSGILLDKMFDFNQSGTSGLWLKWERNESAPVYGGEIFYQLCYNNEAYRWAFESMEARGLNPRSLKRLVKTSIINREYSVAGKYLNYLDQTLFYRNWARQYKEYLKDTLLIWNDSELAEKRRLLVHSDFISDITDKDIGLQRLLENHPDNKMAYEYLMASFLLRKDLTLFARNLDHIREMGYKHLPKHFEEAIILYTGITRERILPDGFSISTETQNRFHNYANVFAANRHSMALAAKRLQKDFGNTLWYYFQFASITMDSDKLSAL